MKTLENILALVLLAMISGCGDDDNPSPDAPPQVTIDAATAIDSAGGGTALTVKNFDSWCSVTVDNGQPSSSAMQTKTVQPGTIDLAAVALAGFQLGATPWHDTDGDTGAGEQGTVTGTGQAASSATTITVGATPVCVWVCCEFTGGGGCPTDDQCP